MIGTGRSDPVPELLEDGRGKVVDRRLDWAASVSRSAVPLFRTGAWPTTTHGLAATSHTATPSVQRLRPGFMDSPLQSHRAEAWYQTTMYLW